MNKLEIILFFILTVSVNAQTTWYVSPSGNDTLQGTETEPFSTIRKALRTASSGDIINIDAGTYTNPLTINNSGITLKAWHPENKPVIEANSPAFENQNFVIRWTSNSISDSYNNNIIDGIIIRNAVNSTGLYGISINGNNNIIRNCEISNINRTGILVFGSNNIIENNIISGISGIVDAKLAGNNISIESYYYKDSLNEVRRNSENNIIRYNILKNNPTHFGINIFPNTQDSTQPFMSGNEIYNNYIDSTGGGIYTRYQKNLLIYNNFILHSYIDTTWETTGGGITLDLKESALQPIPFDAGRVRIYNNTIADNQYFGVKNITSNGVEIYNNIFVDNFAGLNGEGYGHIQFAIDSAQINSTCRINSNLYYGRGCWRWGSATVCDFESWKLVSGRDSISFFNDPYFEDQANGNYKLRYFSHAKNRGRSLYYAGVVTDYYNNPRPYWNRNFDIGAFEISDAQFKLGAVGIDPETEIIHTIKNIGSKWERDPAGIYNLSQDNEIDSSVFITKGDYSSVPKENWRGFTLKWMYPQQPDSNRKYGVGFYKLTNSLTKDSIYIDNRDAAINSSPNIFIRLNKSVEPSRYEYFDGRTFREAYNGQVLRTWKLNHSSPNTSQLKEYWQQSLIWLNSNGHPRIIFGELPDTNIAGYRLYKRNSEKEQFTYITLTKDSLEYTDNFTLSDTTSGIFPEYYVTPTYADNTEGMATNLIQLAKPENYIKPVYSYALLQNYPNPFNLGTNITYSIGSDGNVLITLYDILGRKVRTLLNETKPAGTYKISFNGAGLASGVYFYKITSGSYTQIKKLQLLK
ncbi:MAG: right-handed parallel beta-helix repeat-containing protein [Methanococcaceae archaeon]